MSYLLDYNPGTQQWGYPRRGGNQLSGTIIVHTAECAADNDGADTSAEGCANMIANRADYGSYHRLVDSDSIIDMLPWEYEAWQDSETNNWAVGISAAVRTSDWAVMPADRRDRVYRNLAACAADFVQYMASKGITVPLRRITGAEARARVPGFCAHGDSGIARTDPGANFDWALFFNYTSQALGGSLSYASESILEDDMFTDEDRALLRATLNKADGGQLRADLGYQNETLFSKADGAWQNGLLADISARLGRTLDKADGGYIVGLLEAVKPGSTDAGAIAEAVVSAVGKDVAAEVVKALGEKLGAA